MDWSAEHGHTSPESSQMDSNFSYTAEYGGALSPRELEVLHWVCLGKTNSEIGQILGISHWTAKVHVGNVLRKLNASNRTQAAAFAAKYGLCCDSQRKSS